MKRRHSLLNLLIDIADRARTHDYRKTYNLADSFRFNGPGTLLYGPGQINIGPNTYIGTNSSVNAAEGCQVTIGENSAIGHGVRIYTQSRDPDYDIKDDTHITRGNVTIGDKVWIGMNVYIGPGITIGDHAVVGANSVVTKDVESYMIVGGVPAKPIRRKVSAPALVQEQQRNPLHPGKGTQGVR